MDFIVWIEPHYIINQSILNMWEPDADVENIQSYIRIFSYTLLITVVNYQDGKKNINVFKAASQKYLGILWKYSIVLSEISAE